MKPLASSRPALLGHALRLEYLTVGWNIAEGVIAVTAAWAANSIALLAFGVDSFVESASGAVLIWRLRTERAKGDACEIERIEQRAHKLVAGSLLLLAIYVAIDAIRSLAQHEQPEASIVGIALTAVSLAVMWRLARAKRSAAVALGSRAMEADAFQTTACWWLSLIALSGIGLNASLGWWWADPAAAIAMTPLLVREAREAWRGEACCD